MSEPKVSKDGSEITQLTEAEIRLVGNLLKRMTKTTKKINGTLRGFRAEIVRLGKEFSELRRRLEEEVQKDKTKHPTKTD